MKLFITSIFLFVFASTITAQNWEKYKSEELTFIAEFPGTPEKSVQQIQTAVGELDMHMVMYSPSSGDDNAVYSVIRSDYPEAQFENADESYNNQVLNGAVQGAVSNVQGTLLYDNKVKFNGYPSRDVKIEITGGFIYIKAYLVENIIFITQVICTEDKDGNESIKRFQDSFDIINVKQ
tara:strand:- start:995 stop:1531 length:537 start_codon:yes stop_codon:yes gene_type:complete